MSSDDPRKDYLARVIMDQLVGSGETRKRLAKSVDETFASLCDGGPMDAFLDQSSGDRPLQALLIQSSGQLEIRLYNEVQADDAEAMMCFTKVGNESITAENVHRTVQITSAPRSTVAGLYSSLHSVFLPLLKQKGKLDPAVARLLNDLDASLGSVVRGSAGSAVDIHEITGILKLQDEISFWQEYSNRDENARSFSRPLISKLTTIDKR